MRQPIRERDSDRTGFTATLEALLETLPDALCATFLDGEGETIDLATRVDPFDARIFSAEFALPLASMRSASRELGVGATRELRLIGESRCALVRYVSDGCDVLVVLDGETGLGRASFECARAAARLAFEAGLPSWRPVSVSPVTSSGAMPEAFIEDGRTRRVAAVLGAPDSTMTESLLVRTREGDECVIARDPTTERWFRL